MSGARLLALVIVGLFLGTSAGAGAQVWKPRMEPGARAKAKAASPKKGRRAKPSSARRAKAEKATVKPAKKKRRAKQRKARDDDFTILEEDYPKR